MDEGASQFSSKLESLMALLIESGVVYCILWVRPGSHGVCREEPTLAVSDYLPFVLVPASRWLPGFFCHGQRHGTHVGKSTHDLPPPSILPLMQRSQGIYPTVIIILVCLNRSHCDRYSTYTHKDNGSMRFATAPTEVTTLSTRTRDKAQSPILRLSHSLFSSSRTQNSAGVDVSSSVPESDKA
jgi:hypothetical protein